MNDETTANQSALLTRVQIRTLLELALEPQQPVGHETRVPGARTSGAQRLLDAVGTRAGERCDGVLARAADPATPLSDLWNLKELAKRLAARAETSAERDAAALLYHLSIAAALGHHGEHISNEPLQRQKDVYVRLSRLFRGDVTGDVFEKASE